MHWKKKLNHSFFNVNDQYSSVEANNVLIPVRVATTESLIFQMHIWHRLEYIPPQPNPLFIHILCRWQWPDLSHEWNLCSQHFIIELKHLLLDLMCGAWRTCVLGETLWIENWLLDVMKPHERFEKNENISTLSSSWQRFQEKKHIYHNATPGKHYALGHRFSKGFPS